MIKTHKGFQSLNIQEIPSFQQHEANQNHISNSKYRENLDEEKGTVSENILRQFFKKNSLKKRM